MNTQGPWHHQQQSFLPPRRLSIFLMLATALCVSLVAAVGAVTVSKGIANLAHFNVNQGVDQ